MRDKLLKGIILSSFLLLHASCGGGKGNVAAELQVAQRDTATYELPMPLIPESMTSPEERAAYVAERYWNPMDWNDTLLLASERFMGTSMANFGFFLSMIPQDKATSDIVATVNAASGSPKALKALSDYAYRYFYYPDSPQYDAELYLKFINPLVAQENLDEADRQRLEERRRDILKNRIGTVPANFRFIGTDGNNHNLTEALSGANLYLLMLYDPDCQACDEAVQILKGSESFTQAQRDKEVKVIAINAFGQESGGAAKRKPSFPTEWIVGYSPDGEIDEQEIYAIRATPAIYVIDAGGKILEKDLSLRRLAELISDDFT